MTTSGTPVKAAFVGVGRYAQEHDIPALLALALEGLVEVRAVADVDQALAARVAEEFGVPGSFGPLHERAGVRSSYADVLEHAFPIPRVYGSLEEMVEGEGRFGGIDAVKIVVPNDAHAATAVRAMELGLHVKGQKPMATTLEDAARMRDTAWSLKRLLTIGYQYSQAGPWERERILRGDIGKIRRIFGRWHRSLLIPDNEWFWNDPARGGVNFDLPGHLLAWILTLMQGEPVSVAASGWADTGKALWGDRFRVKDTVTVTIRFSDNALVVLDTSWANNGPPEEELGLVVYGQAGRAVVPLLARELDADKFRGSVSYRMGDEVISEEGPPATLYTEAVIAQDRNWLRAIQGLDTLWFTPDHALAVEALVDGIRRSLELNGREVTV
jgi:predicted dehydrogenase